MIYVILVAAVAGYAYYAYTNKGSLSEKANKNVGIVQRASEIKETGISRYSAVRKNDVGGGFTEPDYYNIENNEVAGKVNGLAPSGHQSAILDRFFGQAARGELQSYKLAQESIVPRKQILRPQTDNIIPKLAGSFTPIVHDSTYFKKGIFDVARERK